MSKILALILVPCFLAALLSFGEIDCNEQKEIQLSGMKRTPMRRRTAVLLKSQEDLLKYIEYVNQLYAVRGRARYGKRRSIDGAEDEQPTMSNLLDNSYAENFKQY